MTSLISESLYAATGDKQHRETLVVLISVL